MRRLANDLLVAALVLLAPLWAGVLGALTGVIGGVVLWVLVGKILWEVRRAKDRR